jgi:hypothetical protein
MTHLSPDSGALPSPSSSRSRPAPVRPAKRRPFYAGALLTLQIEFRRMRLAELEAGMVATCEEAALGGHPPKGAGADREHWDRATWHRYLAAAMRLEATYGPPMRRLQREIGQLERLRTLLPVDAMGAPTAGVALPGQHVVGTRACRLNLFWWTEPCDVRDTRRMTEAQPF